MKIKVVVDKTNKEEWTYAVYHGFAQPCILLPLYTDWVLDRKGMTAEELGVYLSYYMDEECVIKFPFGSYHIWEKNQSECGKILKLQRNCTILPEDKRIL